MANKSICKRPGIIFSGLVIMLIAHLPTPQGAELLVNPMGSCVESAPPSLDQEGGQRDVGLSSVAKRHILVELHPRADKLQFLQKAKGQGLQQLDRVYGSNWLIMSIPEAVKPRQAAAAARGLPWVLRATPDPIVRINDYIPHDPIYKRDDDGDPSTKPCDPLSEVCDPWDLVDQWGLFQVGAQGGWDVQRGDPEIVIAILDSGIDLDHDDLWGNIWVNPGEIEGNGEDDDGNGFVDDVHGADFCGDNVGGLLDNPASKDPDPDIPTGGEWVYDFSTWLGVRFDGDPAVGDADDNNLDGWVDVGVFHGTFVAGVAGAMTDNVNSETGEYEGMAGACWHCKLMPVRLINAEGWAFGSDAAAAVNYATGMGADIINVSWGIEINSADPSLMSEILVLSQAIDNAVSKGVIVVAAAGNSGTAGLHFPACMPNTIAVGSSNWLDQRSEFSSFSPVSEIPDNGIDDDGNGWVDDTLDVLAPGEMIWSTAVLSAYDALLYDFLEMSGWQPGDDTYGQADGTSFATPLVSGYVALILSQNSGATLGQVREVIRSNATDILDPNGDGNSLLGYDAYSGFGRINMFVPNLVPAENQLPIVLFGGDQTVADTGKPGTEAVTLDGSGSYDPDGTIVSYQWLENREQIATGMRTNVNFTVGSHTVTLRVTDDNGAYAEGQVTVNVTEKQAGGGKKPPKNRRIDQ